MFGGSESSEITQQQPFLNIVLSMSNVGQFYDILFPPYFFIH